MAAPFRAIPRYKGFGLEIRETAVAGRRGSVLGFWVRSATKFGKAAVHDECGTVGQRTP